MYWNFIALKKLYHNQRRYYVMVEFIKKNTQEKLKNYCN